MDAGPSYSYQNKNALPTYYMVTRKRKEVNFAQQHTFPLRLSASRN